MTKEIHIRRPSEDEIEFWVDGDLSGSASVDEVGRDGMLVVESLVEGLAVALGIDMIDDGSGFDFDSGFDEGDPYD